VVPFVDAVPPAVVEERGVQDEEVETRPPQPANPALLGSPAVRILSTAPPPVRLRPGLQQPPVETSLSSPLPSDTTEMDLRASSRDSCDHTLQSAPDPASPVAAEHTSEHSGVMLTWISTGSSSAQSNEAGMASIEGNAIVPAHLEELVPTAETLASQAETPFDRRRRLEELADRLRLPKDAPAAAAERRRWEERARLQQEHSAAATASRRQREEEALTAAAFAAEDSH